MIRINLRLIAAVAALAASTIPPAAAQSYSVHGKIPFAFRAGRSGILPAGEYSLQRASNSSWVLRHDVRAVSVMSAAGNVIRPESRRSPATLEFRCAAEDCVLSGVYMPGETLGNAIGGPAPRAADPGVKIAVVRVVVAD